MSIRAVERGPRGIFCLGKRQLPLWRRSCGAEASLELQSRQALVGDNITLTRLINQILRKVRRSWSWLSSFSCLIKGLLVTDLGKPVSDQLLIITLLVLARRIVLFRPEPKLVRPNRVR